MKIDINENIASIVDKHPQIKDDLMDIGFNGLDNPMMMETVAKKMSPKRGAKMLGIKDIEIELENLGYEVYDSSMDPDVIKRKEKIKSYIKRLTLGEDLETVKIDFVNNFKNVSSSEIMDAEESLLEEGVDKNEVRRLCDVHSALFHGMTENENMKSRYENPVLEYFYDENKKIKNILNYLKENISNDIFDNIDQYLITINSHYKKKGDLLYPYLKSEYKKNGPSQVMWAVDNEILRDLKLSIKSSDIKLLEDTLLRSVEMTYKEENILYPLIDQTFSSRDFIKIYNDLIEYDRTILDKYPYNEAKNSGGFLKESDNTGYINFSKGKLSIEQLKALLDTLEIEITFVDDNDINTYYNDNKDQKIFKRPSSSLGRDVYSCHPPQVENKVRKIISDFKEGKRDKVQIIRNIGESDYAITYYAVHNSDGDYIGVLETVQNMDFYKNYIR